MSIETGREGLPSPALNETGGSGGRLLYPDLLRSLAIYLVVGLHVVGGAASSGSLLGTPLWWCCNFAGLLGRMGVPLFFMLSGYLLLNDPRTADPLPFYRRRFARLLPAFLFWDAVCFVLRGITEQRGFSPMLFLSELVLRGSDYHLWFIYQIAALYLLAPFLRMIVERAPRRSLWILMGVILLVPTVLRLVNVLQHALWISPFQAPVEGYAGFFLLGWLLGTGEYTPRRRLAIYALGLLALAAAALGNRHFSYPDRMNMYFNEGYALNHYFTASAFFLLIRALSERLGDGWRKPAQTLSRLSFGVYFCHVLLLRLFSTLLPGWGLPADSARYLVCLFLLTAFSATAAAWVFSKIPVLRRLV